MTYVIFSVPQKVSPKNKDVYGVSSVPHFHFSNLFVRTMERRKYQMFYMHTDEMEIISPR